MHGYNQLKHNPFLSWCYWLFSSMPSFLYSAELERLEAGGRKLWEDLAINLFWKDISKFLTLSVLHTLFINFKYLMYISSFHSHEDYKCKYCWNAYEREIGLVYPRRLKSFKCLRVQKVFIHHVKLVGHCLSR